MTKLLPSYFDDGLPPVKTLRIGVFTVATIALLGSLLLLTRNRPQPMEPDVLPEPVDVAWVPIPKLPAPAVSAEPSDPRTLTLPEVVQEKEPPRPRVFESPFLLDAPEGIGSPVDGLVVPVVAEPSIPVFWLKTLPRVLERGILRYPPELKKERIEGRVVLLILIEEAGRVEVKEVLEATNRGFVESAIAAAEDSRFEPPLRDGRAVRSYYKLPFSFQLNSGR